MVWRCVFSAMVLALSAPGCFSGGGGGGGAGFEGEGSGGSSSFDPSDASPSEPQDTPGSPAFIPAEPDGGEVDPPAAEPGEPVDGGVRPPTRVDGGGGMEAPVPPPDTHFDDATGLEWATGSVESAFGPFDAETYCDQLVLDGYSDWRLPSISELRTLSQCAETRFAGMGEELAACRVHDNCTVLSQCYDEVLCGGCPSLDGLDPALDLSLDGEPLWSRTDSDGGARFVLRSGDGAVEPRPSTHRLGVLCVRQSLYLPDYGLASCGAPCGQLGCDEGQICADTADGGLCIPLECNTCMGGICDFNLSYSCSFVACR